MSESTDGRSNDGRAILPTRLQHVDMASEQMLHHFFMAPRHSCLKRKAEAAPDAIVVQPLSSSHCRMSVRPRREA